jgi:hypothetical protein
MRLAACVLAYNDEWCIGLSARALLRFCDVLLVGLHRSTDRTAEILAEVAAEVGSDRVRVVEQDDVVPRVEYPIEQSGGTLRRDHLGNVAREMGATHVLVIDDDEVLTANVATGFRDLLAAVGIVYLPWISVWDDPDAYRTTWRQMLPFAFPVDAGTSWYESAHGRFPVAVAAAPYPPAPHVPWDAGGAMHLQYLSRRRLAAKRLMYRLYERIVFPTLPADVINARFNESIVPPTPAEMAPIPPAWWAGLEDLRARHLHPETPPWHEEECRRIVRERGPGVLDGLELGGVEL